MGSIEQENSVCWVHRGAACVGHRLRGTASVGGPSGNGMCHRGRRAVHQARRTARVGVHRARGNRARRAACGGPIGQEEQLCWPPIGQEEQRVVAHRSVEQTRTACGGPVRQGSVCCVHRAGRTAGGGSVDTKNSMWSIGQEEQRVVVPARRTCVGLHRTRSSLCWGKKNGMCWVHRARGAPTRSVVGPSGKKNRCGVHQGHGRGGVGSPRRSLAERGGRADEGLQRIVRNGTWAQNHGDEQHVPRSIGWWVGG